MGQTKPSRSDGVSLRHFPAHLIHPASPSPCLIRSDLIPSHLIRPVPSNITVATLHPPPPPHPSHTTPLHTAPHHTPPLHIALHHSTQLHSTPHCATSLRITPLHSTLPHTTPHHSKPPPPPPPPPPHQYTSTPVHRTAPQVSGSDYTARALIYLPWFVGGYVCKKHKILENYVLVCMRSVDSAPLPLGTTQLDSLS